MNLKIRLFLIIAAIFSVFALIIWLYSESISSKINEDWAARFVSKQVMFDKYRTLLPIIHEVFIVKQLAKEPSIIAMAKDENNTQVRDNGIKTLERYRTKFEDRSYFAAFTASGNYYFNESYNEFNGKQLRYKLSPNQAKDSWFYKTIKIADTYQINVDKDKILNVNKVWINYLLRSNGKVLGVIGTGFDFDQFLKDSVGVEQEGIRNFFIDKNLSIQLAKDPSMIDYASITKKDGTHKTIHSIITNAIDIERIKEAMSRLENIQNKENVETLWINIQGSKHLVGIAYQQDIGWFSVTIFDNKALSIIDNKNIFIFITLLFLIAMAVIFITFRKSVADLRASENKFRAIFDFTNDAIMLLDEKGFLDCNKATLKMFDCATVAEFCQYHPSDLSPQKQPCGKDSMVLASQHIRNAMKNDYEHFEWVHQRTNQGEIFFADVLLSVIDIGGKKILQAVVRDENERKKIEVEIQTLAFYDMLTKLPNRRLLGDRLAQAQLLSKRNRYYGAILFMDLDNFKPLNDKYGHTVGDLLLVEVAQRIKTCVRESDTVARFGGDEFIVLLSELDTDQQISSIQAITIAEKIRLTLFEPYYLEIISDVTANEKIVEHYCSASIGLTLFIDNEVSQDEIINQADSAMYEAKKYSRNCVRQYTIN